MGNQSQSSASSQQFGTKQQRGSFDSSILSQYQYLNNSTYTPLTQYPKSSRKTPSQPNKKQIKEKKKNSKVELGKNDQKQHENMKEAEEQSQKFAVRSKQEQQKLLQKQIELIKEHIKIIEQQKRIKQRIRIIQKQQREELQRIKAEKQEQEAEKKEQQKKQAQKQQERHKDPQQKWKEKHKLLQQMYFHQYKPEEHEQRRKHIQDTIYESIRKQIQQHFVPHKIAKIQATIPPQEQTSIYEGIHLIGVYMLGLLSYLQTFKKYITSNSSYIKFKNSLKEYKNQYVKPIRQLYQSLPQTFTQMKFDINREFTFNQRLAFLSFASVLVGLGTLRWSQKKFGSKLFSMVRNTTAAYLIGGIFIAPQIYFKYFKCMSQDKSSKVQNTK